MTEDFIVGLNDNDELLSPEEWDQRYAEALEAVRNGKIPYMNIGINMTGLFFELDPPPFAKRFYQWPTMRPWRLARVAPSPAVAPPSENSGQCKPVSRK